MWQLRPWTEVSQKDQITASQRPKNFTSNSIWKFWTIHLVLTAKENAPCLRISHKVIEFYYFTPSLQVFPIISHYRKHNFYQPFSFRKLFYPKTKRSVQLRFKLGETEPPSHDNGFAKAFPASQPPSSAGSDTSQMECWTNVLFPVPSLLCRLFDVRYCFHGCCYTSLHNTNAKVRTVYISKLKIRTQMWV